MIKLEPPKKQKQHKALLIGAWLFACFCLFFLLVYADKYVEETCTKSGGSYVMGTWTKECKHK